MDYYDLDDMPALTSEYVETCRLRDELPRPVIDYPRMQGNPHEGICFSVLGSGSKGNSALVRAYDTAVLIDCGFSCKDFLARCEILSFDPTKLDALVITHEHGDHTKGLGVVLRHLARQNVHPTLYTTSAIHQASRLIREVESLVDIVHIAATDEFDIGSLRVASFATSHDSCESMGFRFEAGYGSGLQQKTDVLGYVTDTGLLDDHQIKHLSGARILALESNHDPHMLKIGPYPSRLQRRVAGDTGHLSNQQAACGLEQLLHSGLETVVAMHLSETNNLPRHSLAALTEVCQRACHPAHIYLANQYEPTSFR